METAKEEIYLYTELCEKHKGLLLKAYKSIDGGPLSSCKVIKCFEKATYFGDLRVR